jgi:serine/threonine-protein kinase
MPVCVSCGSEIPDDKRFCADCGTAADSAFSPTRTSAAGSVPVDSHPSLDQARFIPGTVLAGRYRIVGLLGLGGMGEVYRADDLKLGQPVALKFLPEAVGQDPGRLQRFLNEVRTALKVSHPNVCRVHDIGELQDQHYLSMEYVDGEDLSSLLRRIGRLPKDKAVQIARQICAGLAAAHQQGILHRDLKPANVMIDGRGRAKITDFGLAALAETLEGAEVRSGTPGYMAPEQIAGKEASVRSDVYALGLVLYELFTGRRAFEGDSVAEVVRLQQESTPTDPSSFVEDLDPAVERTILRCLERDPIGRPANALAVSASLPGGDPLQAALAEGETPSPEMVAAAGPEGGLRTGVATTCLLVGLAGLLGGAWFSGHVLIENRLSWVKSFEALKDDAREMVVELGYEGPPGDSTGYFLLRREDYVYRIRLAQEDVSETLVEKGREPIRLFYRQSPSKLVPETLGGRISHENPSVDPGGVVLELDIHGRLRYLRVTPTRLDRVHGPDPPPDWGALFDAAGLDLGRFEPTVPTLRPPEFADTRAAWTGSLSDGGDVPVRIEAASLRGKPVYFRTLEPSDGELWSGVETDLSLPRGVQITIVVTILGLLGILLAGAVLLAVRTLRLGRGDRKGALRVALVVFALRMLHWLLAGHHIAHVFEVYTAFIALSGALTLAVIAWLLYIALEPYVRRFWPEAMVSWSRLLAGRIHDPLVGRDVLVGFTALGTLSLLSLLALWVAKTAGISFPFVQEQTLPAMRGGRFAVGALFSAPLLSLAMASALTLGLLLLRIVLKKTWLAVLVLCTLWGLLQGIGSMAIIPPDRMLVGAVFLTVLGGFGAAAMMVLLVRFGFLALITAFVLSGLLGNYARSLDPSLPHFTSSLIGPLVVAAIGILAYRASIAHQPKLMDRV